MGNMASTVTNASLDAAGEATNDPDVEHSSPGNFRDAPESTRHIAPQLPPTQLPASDSSDHWETTSTPPTPTPQRLVVRATAYSDKPEPPMHAAHLARTPLPPSENSAPSTPLSSPNQPIATRQMPNPPEAPGHRSRLTILNSDTDFSSINDDLELQLPNERQREGGQGKGKAIDTAGDALNPGGIHPSKKQAGGASKKTSGGPKQAAAAANTGVKDADASEDERNGGRNHIITRSKKRDQSSSDSEDELPPAKRRQKSAGGGKQCRASTLPVESESSAEEEERAPPKHRQKPTGGNEQRQPSPVPIESESDHNEPPRPVTRSRAKKAAASRSLSSSPVRAGANSRATTATRQRRRGGSPTVTV
ncbi:hypothetical protein BCR34DRAFT_591061 [Clohesyomyces aquaticus]|uniref:Uncharacterized protein n=1 Tax=Clohesyomyces aquaticus TaxID=1231657 RepID=A0A1Y1Z5A0_9PLEO|nr:hypothetical protein BCR34DRAFT_591061 [Clohesyomyces aquaticus]